MCHAFIYTHMYNVHANFIEGKHHNLIKKADSWRYNSDNY